MVVVSGRVWHSQPVKIGLVRSICRSYGGLARAYRSVLSDSNAVLSASTSPQSTSMSASRPVWAAGRVMTNAGEFVTWFSSARMLSSSGRISVLIAPAAASTSAPGGIARQFGSSGSSGRTSSINAGSFGSAEKNLLPVIVMPRGCTTSRRLVSTATLSVSNTSIPARAATCSRMSCLLSPVTFGSLTPSLSVWYACVMPASVPVEANCSMAGSV